MKTIFIFGYFPLEVIVGSRLYKLCISLKKEFPNVRFRHKRKIWYHWIAHIFICIFTIGMNRRYISAFTTTGKKTIDWSDTHWDRMNTGKELDRVWECLLHEREHLRQFKKYTRLGMVLLWLIPPILFCYGRAVLIEKPGFLESFRAKIKTDPKYALSAEYKKWWVSRFTGPSYGWMFIWKSKVEKWFDDEAKNQKRRKSMIIYRDK